MYKPVILIGNGCRSNPALVEHLCSLNIPVLTTWMAMDMVAEDNQAFCGRPGVFGQRAANIIQQSSDKIFVFGARLDNDQVAHRIDNFAPRAEKYIFDIDQAELDKLPSSYGWFKSKSHDITNFAGVEITGHPDPAWLPWCKALYNRFRPELEGKTGEYVDPFYFQRILGDLLTPDDVIALGSSGGAPVSFLQTFKIKKGQRVTGCSTIGAMGADIPMAIGACLGSGRRRTICITGDGGFMLNVQELEVVRRLNLPIKFFVFNNNGYGSIRNMQNARFDGRHVGCDPESGLTLPPLKYIALSYNIKYYQLVEKTHKWDDKIQQGIYSKDPVELLTWALSDDRPLICEVMIDPAYQQYPRVMSTGFQADAMEDMTPKLDPAELKEIMDYGNT